MTPSAVPNTPLPIAPVLPRVSTWSASFGPPGSADGACSAILPWSSVASMMISSASRRSASASTLPSISRPITSCEREQAVERLRDGRGPGPGDAERVGGAADRRSPGERPGVPGARRHEGHGGGRELGLHRGTGHGAVVDRVDRVGRALDLELLEHVGELPLVPGEDRVVLEPERRPVTGGGGVPRALCPGRGRRGRRRVQRCRAGRGPRRRTPAAAPARRRSSTRPRS